MKKQKKIKAWAVLFTNKLLDDGWGTSQSWIFRTKWLAQEEIDSAIEDGIMDEKDIKVVKVEIKLLD